MAAKQSKDLGHGRDALRGPEVAEKVRTTDAGRLPDREPLIRRRIIPHKVVKSDYQKEPSMPPTIATSLKLPAELKAAIDEDARKQGISSHAYMVQTLADAAERARQREQFTQDALVAEQDMLARGGYDLADVTAYFEARARGERPVRPPLRPVVR